MKATSNAMSESVTRLLIKNGIVLESQRRQQKCFHCDLNYLCSSESSRKLLTSARVVGRSRRRE